MVEKLAAAVYNDIVQGLKGITSTPTISMDQLIDDIIDERLQIIKEYSLKNLIPRRDLLMAINCISTDCESLDKCPCGENYTKPQLHFEIPQILNDFGDSAIEYIGAIDKQKPFKVYLSTAFTYHKYLRRGAAKPFVFVNTVPNERNMYDCWVFNSPLLKKISVIAIFKDPRQLEDYDCCAGYDLENFSFISAEIKKRLTEKKIRYYKSFYQPVTPNTQEPK